MRPTHYLAQKNDGAHYAAPKANAICERFVGSARRERLDHMLIFVERQFGRVLGGSKEYFDEARPHQGLAQRIR